MTKWRSWLGRKGPEEGPGREGSSAQVNDPRARAEWSWALFGKGGATHQTVAVQVLGQIDAAGASRGLAMLALSGQVAGGPPEGDRDSQTARSSRKRRECLSPCSATRSSTQVRPVNGPGSAGVLFVEGKRFNVQRLYNAPRSHRKRSRKSRSSSRSSRASGLAVERRPDLPNGFKNSSNPVIGQQLGRSTSVSNPTAAPGVDRTQATDWIVAVQGTSPQSLSSVYSAQNPSRTHPGKERMINEFNYNLAEAQNAAIAAQQQLAADVGAIESYNQSAERDQCQGPVAVNGDFRPGPGPGQRFVEEVVDRPAGICVSVASSNGHDDRPTYTEVRGHALYA